MADPLTVLAALSDPGVTAVIGAVIGVVGGGVVGYFLGRHWRSEDRRLSHSRKLKDDVLVPWSRAQVVQQTDWKDSTYFEPRIHVDPQDLREQAPFRWAASHLEGSNYRYSIEVWKTAEDTLSEAGARSVDSLKAKIRADFGRSVEREFHGRVGPIATSSEYQKDVYSEDVVVYIIVRELVEIFAGHRELPRGLEFATVPLGAGAAYVGSGVRHGDYDVARVSSLGDADAKAWGRAFDSVVNSQSIRAVMQEALEHEAYVAFQLKLFKALLAEVIQRVEAGLPLEGKCELGF